MSRIPTPPRAFIDLEIAAHYNLLVHKRLRGGLVRRDATRSVSEVSVGLMGLYRSRSIQYAFYAIVKQRVKQINLSYLKCVVGLS